MAALEPGATAPAFTLRDIDREENRQPRFDRLTLLAFYKVTCPVCQMAMPYLDHFKAYESAGLQILGVVEDPADTGRLFRETYGGPSEALSEAPPYPVSSAYGLTNVPTVFLVEPSGRIAHTQVSFDKDGYNDISAEIARRLGVPAVEVAPADDGNPDFRPG